MKTPHKRKGHNPSSSKKPLKKQDRLSLVVCFLSGEYYQDILTTKMMIGVGGK